MVVLNHNLLWFARIQIARCGTKTDYSDGLLEAQLSASQARVQLCMSMTRPSERSDRSAGQQRRGFPETGDRDSKEDPDLASLEIRGPSFSLPEGSRLSCQSDCQ